MATATREEIKITDPFAGELKTGNTTGGTALQALRARGKAAYQQLGLPTTRDEAWRQTSLKTLLNTKLSGTQAPASEPAAELLEQFRYPGMTGVEVLFHNGQLVRISGADALPKGVKVLDLAAAVDSEKALVEAHLGAYAKLDSNAFIALNTAFLEAGIAIIVPRGVILENPIHLLFLTTTSQPIHTHPRVLVLTGESSQATIVETWGCADANAVYFNNPVVEVATGANAVLNHIKVQRESLAAFHIGNAQFHQERDSQIHSHLITLGGALVRNETGAFHDGEGVHCTLNGLYITQGTQHVDNATRLDHAKPNCTSHEVYKGILDDQSSGVFTGRIYVHPDAQKTDAIQSNRALLLSPDATINTQPQLEIFADDVKCTHGATIGQLNANALFYLRARGINKAAAEGLLTYAFANDLVEQLPCKPVREHLEHFLARHFNIVSD